jgi:drug/metabolite transporter (DMT)-like permease
MNPFQTSAQPERQRLWLPYALLTIAPLCWAGNVVVARGIVDTFPPVSLAFWRWSIATLILLPFARQQAMHDWKTALSHWKILVLLSITGISVFNTLLYMSVQTTTAINAALIQTIMPAVIIVFSRLIFREKIRLVQTVGLVVSMVGALVVIMRGQLSNVLQLAFVQGDLLMFLAIFFYALYSVFLKKRPAMHPLSFLFYIMAMGSLGLLPIYLWECINRCPPGVEATFVFSILYFALFPSLIAYYCWNKGVALIGANRAGLFINLIPVFASFMAVTWLHESLELFHFAGLMLVFAGMVLFNR